MSFTAKDIQALREITGAGMMDCKKALEANEGNQEKAITFLREKGLAAVVKKSSRVAAEGACFAVVSPETGVGAMVEINSETDFAAKSDKFMKFLSDVTNTVCMNNAADVAELKTMKMYGSEQTIEAELQDKVFTIGENIQIRRFTRYEHPTNAAYVHMGGKIAVLVHMHVSDNLKGHAALNELGRDIAMQTAAMRPQWLNSAAVPADAIENERAIYKEQLAQDEKNKNKPEAVIAKIIDGRIGKFYSEVCLLEQPFVKENSLSVAQYVAQKAKELGGTIEVAGFTRYEKGEGLAKKEDDFASEVARMTGK